MVPCLHLHLRQVSTLFPGHAPLRRRLRASPQPLTAASASPCQVRTMAGTSDLDRQIEQLRRCEYIKEAEVKALCAKAREILVEESNVQRVDAPVTVRSPVALWDRQARPLPCNR